MKRDVSSVAEYVLGDRRASRPVDVCNLFAEFFSSVFQQPEEQPPKFEFGTSLNISTCSFKAAEVERKLASLDPRKGTGPDGIPPIVLRHCSSLLAPQLTVYFNKLIEDGIFPNNLKLCYVVPIHKSSAATDVQNYRPIVIQPALSKVFEGLVLDQLYFYFKNIIIPEQHGFSRGRSTVTNLLLYESYIFSAFSKGLQVDSAYIDFSKAFDRISHEHLIAKLEGYGICGSLLDWFRSYLKDRTLLVKFMNATSEPFSAVSGVPQGSLLGPFLFNIFINDIAKIIGVSFLLFADDIKIFQIIRNLADCYLLQESLTRIYEWCISNCMAINPAKCSLVSFSRSAHVEIFRYELCGSFLTRQSSVKDLGVMFSSDLNPEMHINQTCNKALRLLSYIVRASRNGLSTEALMILYLSLVRPTMEYCCVVWCPYLLGQIDRVESVQRRFIRLIGMRLGYGYLDVPVEQLERGLGLLPLLVRRQKIDAVFLYRLLNGYIDCSDLLWMINIRASRPTRSLCLFSCQSHPTNYLMHAPIPRLHRLGNRLSPEFDFFYGRVSVLKRLLHGNFSM